MTWMACADNRFRNDACLVDGHPCMASVEPEQVMAWLEKIMQTSAVRQV